MTLSYTALYTYLYVNVCLLIYHRIMERNRLSRLFFLHITVVCMYVYIVYVCLHVCMRAHDTREIPCKGSVVFILCVYNPRALSNNLSKWIIIRSR